MRENSKTLRREPLSDTQLLMTIAVGMFVVMYAAAMLIWKGGFLRVQQVFDMLNNNAALIIIACGLTSVMITGGIDISVGGVIGLVAMSNALYLNNHPDTVGSILVCALLSLGIGLAFGVVQGWLVAYLDIQPFIVTLAGMFFARGMTTIVSAIPQKIEASVNTCYSALSGTKIEIAWLGYVTKKGKVVPARLELGVVIALVILIAVFFVLKKTRLGRNFYAVGGNSTSALTLGINVRRIKFTAHMLSGLLAGIAGFVYLMHTCSANMTSAQGYEMDAIASSIIGGTMLSGGVGNVFGTFIGTMILSTIKAIVTAAPQLRDPWWQQITTGAMLCFFILLQSVVLSSRAKLHKKRRKAE